MLQIERIDRIGIAVRDLEKARAFFEGVFNIKFDEEVVYKDQNVRLVYSHVGLELSTPMTPDCFLARGIQNRGEGFFGMSFKVPNIEEAVKELQAKGLTVTGEVKVGKMHEVTFHPRDTFGTLFALVAYSEKHPASVAAHTK